MLIPYFIPEGVCQLIGTTSIHKLQSLQANRACTADMTISSASSNPNMLVSREILYCRASPQSPPVIARRYFALESSVDRIILHAFDNINDTVPGYVALGRQRTHVKRCSNVWDGCVKYSDHPAQL